MGSSFRKKLKSIDKDSVSPLESSEEDIDDSKLFPVHDFDPKELIEKFEGWELYKK